MNKVFIIILLAAFGLGSCKTVGLVSNSANLKKRNAKFLIEQLEKNRVNFDWFSAKAKAHFENKEENVSFQIKVRIRKDSLIWLTLSKVSIEGLRVQLSPDRVEVLNRQENTYTAEPFSNIKKQLALPLDFNALENMLVGNPFMLEELDFEVTMDSLHYIMAAPLPDPKNANSSIGNLKLWLNSDYRIVRLDADVGENKLNAIFRDYQEVDGQMIANEKELRLESPETGKIYIKIEFNKVTLDEEQSTKFEVPDHYEKVINGNKIPK
jgi:hypothetical protein